MDFQVTGDVVLFDDYTPTMFPGVVEAVDTICREFNYHKEIITVGPQRGYTVAERK